MAFIQILRALAVGVGYTVLVTVACFATGLAVGLITAMLGRFHLKAVDRAMAAYTYLFRSLPVLVLLFLVFFGLPAIGIKVPPLLSMMLSLGLISGAYISEIFRGAINSVDRDELTAAEASGFTRGQIFLHIIFPQMARFSIPGLTNEFTTVLKYSPFAYTVGIPEIMKEAMSLTAVSLKGLEIYITVGVPLFRHL